jgi:hydroxyethylthiazole kinase-like uncharacterized protein yjeF
MLAQAYNKQMHNHTINQPSHWQPLLPRPDASSHKYNRGYAFIVGGYPVTGAARLAALAAARVGAGITVIAVPEIAFHIYASQLLSIMVKPYTDDTAFEHLIADARINAYLIGPGAGLNQHTRSNTLRMLDTGKPVVIDADALTVFADQPQALADAITGPCVLTPHAGEFAKLTGTEVASSLSLRISQAQQAAKMLNATLLLKGAITIIAAPDGRTLLNDNAPPTLATAGAGDVLAGLITGLLAQGMPAFEATAAASWIHGRAATTFGAGLIADDLPAMIPAVLQAFEATALNQ